jgi:HKD family nuclease
MTTVQTVDNALQQLLTTAKNFPGASLDICSGYISTNGISSLRTMFETARSVRAVVGLNSTNRLNAYRMLRSFGAQVYIYVAPPRTIFHPKIYFGTLETQVWALIGSSNLTESGMATNVEHNLFITGQRHTEPFSSLEARIESFIKQSYPFDREFEKSLLEVERKVLRDPQTNKYDACLLASGIMRCQWLVLRRRCCMLLHGILQNAQRSWLTAREETWLQASSSRQPEGWPGRLHQIDKEASLSTLRTRRIIGLERRWSIFCSEPRSA